jgi:hypothetical protein
MAVLQATEISGSITLSQPLRVPALSNTAIGNLSAQEKAQLVLSSTDGDLHRHDSSNIVRGFGYQGLQGAIGGKGSDGSAGASGYHGLQGLQGGAGAGGDTGARSGTKGPKGPQGNKGLAGDNNSQTGGQGPKGPKGPQGPAGYTGYMGYMGGGGGTGTRGSRSGPGGLAGDTGYQGLQGGVNNQGGAQGPRGPKGPQGTSGYTGYHGNAGGGGPTGPPGWPYQAMDSNSSPTFNTAAVAHNTQSNTYRLWASSHYAVNHSELYNTNNYGMNHRGNASAMNLINKNNATAAVFYSNGNIFMDGSRWSDERSKTQIEAYSGSGTEPSASIVERLSAIKPKKFRFRNTPSDSKYPITIGLIAQDVKTKFPELVNAKNDGTGSADTPEMMGINFTGLRAVLYEAVKEIKTELSGITNRVTTLENA